jgi:hypothetical protein
MSWIKDVGREIRELDVSPKKLREFGLMVGAVFMAIGGWIVYRRGTGPFSLTLLVAGATLVLLGGIAPRSLKLVYKFWMGAALAIGWPISRVLLGILFYGVMTPIGILGRACGTRFLELDSKSKHATFWTPRKKPERSDYEKMY